MEWNEIWALDKGTLKRKEVAEMVAQGFSWKKRKTFSKRDIVQRRKKQKVTTARATSTCRGKDRLTAPESIVWGGEKIKQGGAMSSSRIKKGVSGEKGHRGDGMEKGD